MTTNTNTPVVGPIIALLKSKEFFAAVVTLIVDMVVSLHPAFEAVRVELLAVVTTLGLAVVGGGLAKDIAAARGTPVVKLPLFTPLMDLLRSRKFLVGVGTLIANMVVAQLPSLQGSEDALIAVLTIVGSVLIGSIAYEDGKKAETPKR